MYILQDHAKVKFSVKYKHELIKEGMGTKIEYINDNDAKVTGFNPTTKS